MSNDNELITKGEVIRILETMPATVELYCEVEDGLIAMVRKLSPANAVQKVVRCQNCRYRIDNQGTPWICGHPDNNAWNITLNHYCGYGKEK